MKSEDRRQRTEDRMEGPRHAPKKRFGQHFLRDKNIIHKIVERAELSPDDTVLEIGPGLGDLTAVLVQHAAKVVAVEVDRELYAILMERFGNNPKVEILNSDVLKLDMGQLLKRLGGRVKIVANLPYNISTPILFQFFENREHISSMTLMFQKEVADRLAASPGTKDYGILSVYAQLYTVPSMLFKVSPSAFSPPPKVDSAVVRLEVLPEPSVKADNEEHMLRVVKAAFGQRRKTLLNALSGGMRLSKDIIENVLHTTSIDGSRRGETLTLDEYRILSNGLHRISAI